MGNVAYVMTQEVSMLVKLKKELTNRDCRVTVIDGEVQGIEPMSESVSVICQDCNWEHECILKEEAMDTPPMDKLLAGEVVKLDGECGNCKFLKSKEAYEIWYDQMGYADSEETGPSYEEWRIHKAK